MDNVDLKKYAIFGQSDIERPNNDLVDDSTTVDMENQNKMFEVIKNDFKKKSSLSVASAQNILLD